MAETIGSRVIRIWLSAAVAALLVSGLIGGIAAAATPTVTAPASAVPGETIQITVANALMNPPPASYCVGIYGPGKIIEPEQSPFFRVGIGTVTVGADGSGRGGVTLPTNLVGGVYQIVVGGCPPHPGLAPLAWFAATNITIVAAAPPMVARPPRLPPTGGVPEADLALLGGAGLGLTLAGARLRRPRRD